MHKIYACEPGFLLSYLNKIENATAEQIELAEKKYSGFESESILSVNAQEARIRIFGPLSRTGPTFLDMLFGYGGTSYFEIAEAVKAVENNPAVETIYFDMDTPGGEVAGVDDVWQIIAGCKKRNFAINHDMIASAGYYIASACDKIITRAPTNQTGSIGVVIAGLDFSKAYEEMGVRQFKIVSRNAPRKVPDPMEKDGEAILQERADDIESVFISRISEGRGIPVEDIETNFGRGGMYLADKALEAGMIDGKLYDASMPYKPEMGDTVIVIPDDDDDEEEPRKRIIKLPRKGNKWRKV